jgi:hypothetical protein
VTIAVAVGGGVLVGLAGMVLAGGATVETGDAVQAVKNINTTIVMTK